MNVKCCLHFVCASSLALIVSLFSLSAFAQGEEEGEALVELSKTQINTHNKAVEMLGETPPRTKEAIKLLEAALLMEQRANLLHLTLGRAFQLDGQCEMAGQQFEEAERTPGVKGVPEGFIASQLSQYRQELEACEGSLVIECEPADLKLEVDGASLVCGEAMVLEPGTYVVGVQNTYTGDEMTLPVQISGGEQTVSQIKFGKGRPAPQQEEGENAEGEGPSEAGPEVVEAPASRVRWRVAPMLGYGLVEGVIEPAEEVFAAGELDYYLAGRTHGVWVGLEARVLRGDERLRYGLNFEGSGMYGVVSTREVEDALAAGEDEDEVLLYSEGVRLALQGQVWLRDVFGLYVSGTVRPSIFNKRHDDFGVVGGTLGGGVRGEFGERIGVPSLELYAGMFAPLSGQLAPVHEYDSGVTVLPIEAGVRVQPHGGLTLRVHVEGWAGEGTYDPVLQGEASIDEEARQSAANVRAQQVMVSLGWTWGM